MAKKTWQPVRDEQEVMRQVMGYSFETKWVVLGAVVALALQFVLVGVLWAVMGKGILIGGKGRSLLMVNVESLSQEWGTNKGGTLVQIKIKPDSSKVNTARSLTAVYFAGVKAKPFHTTHLVKFSAACARDCRNIAVAGQRLLAAEGRCAELKPQRAAMDKCRARCAGIAKKFEKDDKKRERAEKKAKCDRCTDDEESTLVRREKVCKKTITRLKNSRLNQESRCTLCSKQKPRYEALAQACESKAEQCWSAPAVQGKPPRPPVRGDYKVQQEFDKAVAAHAKELKRLKEIAWSTLHSNISAYVPAVPKRRGWIDLKLVFRSGEELVKKAAFCLAEPGLRQRPKYCNPKDRPKFKPHDPVGTVGFWLILIISIFVYLIVGFLVGRLAGGDSLREPLVAALAGWLVFMLFLTLIGAGGNAVIFSAFAGFFAFLGASAAGGIVAKRLTGYA